LYLQSAVGKVLQFGPQVVDALLFLLDAWSFAVATCAECVRSLVDVLDVFLVRRQLAEELVKLLLQNLSEKQNNQTKIKIKSNQNPNQNNDDVASKSMKVKDRGGQQYANSRPSD